MLNYTFLPIPSIIEEKRGGCAPPRQSTTTVFSGDDQPNHGQPTAILGSSRPSSKLARLLEEGQRPLELETTAPTSRQPTEQS